MPYRKDHDRELCLHLAHEPDAAHLVGMRRDQLQVQPRHPVEIARPDRDLPHHPQPPIVEDGQRDEHRPSARPRQAAVCAEELRVPRVEIGPEELRQDREEREEIRPEDAEGLRPQRQPEPSHQQMALVDVRHVGGIDDAGVQEIPRRFARAPAHDALGDDVERQRDEKLRVGRVIGKKVVRLDPRADQALDHREHRHRHPREGYDGCDASREVPSVPALQSDGRERPVQQVIVEQRKRGAPIGRRRLSWGG